jgi:hypothetical protein
MGGRYVPMGCSEIPHILKNERKNIGTAIGKLMCYVVLIP